MVPGRFSAVRFHSTRSVDQSRHAEIGYIRNDARMLRQATDQWFGVASSGRAGGAADDLARGFLRSRAHVVLYMSLEGE